MVFQPGDTAGQDHVALTVVGPQGEDREQVGNDEEDRRRQGQRRGAHQHVRPVGEQVCPAPRAEGALALAETAPNLLVTRTFSKIHGLAAERIGWGYGAVPLIAAMHRIRAPFNVTTAGQAAAIAALGDAGFVAASKAHNDEWRAWFGGQIAALGNAGLRAVPSRANFILVLFEGKLSGEAAFKGLMERGYITRWLPNQGLPHALRITIGTEAEMRGVAAALREMVAAA